MKWAVICLFSVVFFASGCGEAGEGGGAAGGDGASAEGAETGDPETPTVPTDCVVGCDETGGGGDDVGGAETGDTEAPTVPTDLAAVASSSSQIDLSWTASTDNVDVTGYTIYRDGTNIGTSAIVSSSDTGLTGSTQYCYTVSAYDAATNESSPTAQVCATTLVSSYPAWGWGWNEYGQAGDGNIGADRLTPFENSGVSNLVDIVSGMSHNLALDTNGDVWSWGRNESGQLGEGAVGTDVDVPTKITGISNVTHIAAGGGNSMAIDSDGDLWIWGDNFRGQIGDGVTGPDRDAPFNLTDFTVGFPAVIAIATGGEHSVALDTNGDLWVWGWNFYGQLGDGTSGAGSNVPQKLASFATVTAIAAGDAHTMALDTNGDLWIWGWNNYGQIGDGTSGTNVLSPYNLTANTVGFANVTKIAGGSTNTFAIDENNDLWVWGRNNFGQIGDGTSGSDVLAPYNLTDNAAGFANIVAVDGGINHTLALDASGDLWAWGWNFFGQIGDGNSGTTVLSPYNISANMAGFENVAALAAGGYHSVALK